MFVHAKIINIYIYTYIYFFCTHIEAVHSRGGAKVILVQQEFNWGYVIRSQVLKIGNGQTRINLKYAYIYIYTLYMYTHMYNVYMYI